VNPGAQKECNGLAIRKSLKAKSVSPRQTQHLQQNDEYSADLPRDWAERQRRLSAHYEYWNVFSTKLIWCGGPKTLRDSVGNTFVSGCGLPKEKNGNGSGLKVGIVTIYRSVAT
jgi:hypothetical protein